MSNANPPTATQPPRYQIGGWQFVPAAVRLRSGAIERRLTPQQLRLLWAFIEAPERTLSKERMIEQVWDGRVVTDDAIARAISELRKQLDLGTDDVYIQTLHGHGYQLAVAVTVLAPEPPNHTVRIGALIGLALLGVLVALWTTSGKRAQRTELALRVEPLQLGLDPQRGYLAVAPAGTQIWTEMQGSNAHLLRHRNSRDETLWQSPGQIETARGSPLGSRIAIVHRSQGCSVVGIDLSTTDLHRWASCSNDAIPAIGWRDEDTLLTARRGRDDMLELAELHWPGAPVVRRIPAADCLQPLQIAQQSDRDPLLSCRTERGAMLYRVAEQSLIEVLSYRSIRLWVEDAQGRIYLASEPAWQPGITRFDPSSGEFAYAETGFIADLAIVDSDLIAVRDRRNLDLWALDLRTLGESVIEGGEQMTRAFTIDPSSGALWRLDDRAGGLAIYAGEEAILKADESEVELSQVVAMAVDRAAGWLVLTTLAAERYQHHWLTLDPIAHLARFEAGSSQLKIVDTQAEYVDEGGQWRAFALDSGGEQTPVSAATNVESLHCPGSPLLAANWHIEILSENNGALFRELDPVNGELRRRWRDSRITDRCGLIQPRLDSRRGRLVYGHQRDAKKDLIRMSVSD